MKAPKNTNRACSVDGRIIRKTASLLDLTTGFTKPTLDWPQARSCAARLPKSVLGAPRLRADGGGCFGASRAFLRRA